MQYDPRPFDTGAALSDHLPAPLDSETAALLRSFLVPVLENAPSWDTLQSDLSDKGFDIAFRHGRLVLISQASGEAVCTGQCLGVPLRDLAKRLGRPNVKVSTGGTTGQLSPSRP